MFAKFANLNKILYLCIEIHSKMDIVFEKEYLSELYYQGKCTDKKHRFQPD